MTMVLGSVLLIGGFRGLGFRVWGGCIGDYVGFRVWGLGFRL